MFDSNSNCLAPISNVILVGEWSLKPPSTTSWLILVHPLLFLLYHHYPFHHPCHRNMPATTHNHPATNPSPLLRDVGSTIHTSGCTKQRTAAPTHPSPKGCGWVHTCLTMELERGNTRGDPRNGRPVQCIEKRVMTNLS